MIEKKNIHTKLSTCKNHICLVVIFTLDWTSKRTETQTIKYFKKTKLVMTDAYCIPIEHWTLHTPNSEQISSFQSIHIHMWGCFFSIRCCVQMNFSILLLCRHYPVPNVYLVEFNSICNSLFKNEEPESDSKRLNRTFP